jgi:hypothetical protein
MPPLSAAYNSRDGTHRERKKNRQRDFNRSRVITGCDLTPLMNSSAPALKTMPSPYSWTTSSKLSGVFGVY